MGGGGWGGIPLRGAGEPRTKNIYIYIYMYMYMYMYTYIYLWVHKYSCIHMCNGMYVCIDIDSDIDIYVSMRDMFLARAIS